MEELGLGEYCINEEKICSNPAFDPEQVRQQGCTVDEISGAYGCDYMYVWTDICASHTWWKDFDYCNLYTYAW
jgi:hypothetical protein